MSDLSSAGKTALPSGGPGASADHEFTVKERSQWQLAWRRFRRHKLAMIGLTIFSVMVFVAIFGPIIWPFDRGALVRCPSQACFAPSLEFPFGTDNGGRSVFTLVANGARISMAVGLATMFIAVSIGVTVGAIAGYFAGAVDGILMRFVDLMLSIPFLFVVLVAARFFGGGDPLILILIFGLLSWPGLARLVRAVYLSLREQEFVLAARVVGCSTRRILARELLPNLTVPIVLGLAMGIPAVVTAEAGLSLLGIGLNGVPSWGTTIRDAQPWWRADPSYLLQPVTALIVLVLALNLLGDAVRDALDPKLR
jgi:ABC-type dipeptide/oligopeptide/nickel transport system permease subunit